MPEAPPPRPLLHPHPTPHCPPRPPLFCSDDGDLTLESFESVCREWGYTRSEVVLHFRPLFEQHARPVQVASGPSGGSKRGWVRQGCVAVFGGGLVCTRPCLLAGQVGLRGGGAREGGGGPPQHPCCRLHPKPTSPAHSPQARSTSKSCVPESSPTSHQPPPATPARIANTPHPPNTHTPCACSRRQTTSNPSAPSIPATPVPQSEASGGEADQGAQGGLQGLLQGLQQGLQARQAGQAGQQGAHGTSDPPTAAELAGAFAGALGRHAGLAKAAAQDGLALQDPAQGGGGQEVGACSCAGGGARGNGRGRGRAARARGRSRAAVSQPVLAGSCC